MVLNDVVLTGPFQARRATSSLGGRYSSLNARYRFEMSVLVLVKKKKTHKHLIRETVASLSFLDIGRYGICADRLKEKELFFI